MRARAEHSCLIPHCSCLLEIFMSRSISILGSTGSVGRSTLAVVDAFPESLRVVGLAAGGNIDLLVQQIERYKPELVSVRDESDVAKLRARVTGVEIVHGS